MTTGKTIALTRWTFVGKVRSLLFNMLSRFVITFLLTSKYLLISWLQSSSAVILETRLQIKSVTVSIASPSICHEVMGQDAMILVFWMLSFKAPFSFFSFTFIKRLFSSSSLSAMRVVHLHIWGYWYFSQQSWFQLVIHPAQRFSWCTLHITFRNSKGYNEVYDLGGQGWPLELDVDSEIFLLRKVACCGPGERVGWVNRPSPASLTVGNSQIQFGRNIQDCSDVKNSSWLSRSLDIMVVSSQINCQLRNLSKCCQGEWKLSEKLLFLSTDDYFNLECREYYSGAVTLHRDRNKYQLGRGQGSEVSLCSPNTFVRLHHNSDSSRTVLDETCVLEDKLQLRLVNCKPFSFHSHVIWFNHLKLDHGFSTKLELKILLKFIKNKFLSIVRGFPSSSDGKESACNKENLDLIPGLGRPPGEGNGNPL